RVEVGAALGPTDALAGQRVLEDLLEAEELDDAQVDARVEAKTALVRAEGGVVLHSVSAVDMDATVVGDPRHAEEDLALGLDEQVDDTALDVLGVLCNHRRDGLEYFAHGLMEFGLAGAAGDSAVINGHKGRV